VKGTLNFNPDGFSYGAATLAVGQIFSEWAAVDWFVTPTKPTAQLRAVRLFEEHNALARALLPDRFPPRIEIETRHGGWSDFHALCERVRGGESKWDWKYSVLKELSREHSKARGWSAEHHARNVTAESPPGPGDLFFRLGDVILWTGLNPTVEFKKELRSRDVDIANWYLSYAGMDVTDCIVWQLAEGSDSLHGNPFLPLIRCYAEGFYPFALSSTEFVLFSFQSGT
jgi:hypothetical protein